MDGVLCCTMCTFLVTPPISVSACDVFAVELVFLDSKGSRGGGLDGWVPVSGSSPGILQWFYAANPKCVLVKLCVTFSLSVCGMDCHRGCGVLGERTVPCRSLVSCAHVMQLGRS